jgi:GDP-mannose transporter
MPPHKPVNEEDDMEMAQVPLIATKTSCDEGEDPQDNRKMWGLRSSGTATAVSACGLYSFCSVSMILVNKSLASSYSHLMNEGSLNILLVVFQAITAVICVETCKHTKLIEAYPPLSWATIKSWAPVNIFFCLMLFTGMASLSTNSVPMVTVFKNVSNIATSLGDYIFFGNKSEPLAMAAFGIMLAGAVLAAWNDIYITPAGLFWMAANCITTSGYVLYMKYATNSIKLSKFGMVYVNNVLW